MIEVANLTKVYGKKKTVFTALDDISFRIPDGQIVAVIGKSGSGKSTLMHVMSGLDRPTTGDVIVNGELLRTMKQKKIDSFRSHQMSFIFQSFFVQGNESCYDNVSLPLEIAGVARSKRKTMVERALIAVELGDKIKSKAKDLSGGQKQRLAIARAIVNDPKVLFADEPTGNLDSTTSATIETLLFDYAKQNGATLIVVTHDDDLAMKCDRQIYMRDGKVQSDSDSQNEGEV